MEATLTTSVDHTVVLDGDDVKEAILEFVLKNVPKLDGVDKGDLEITFNHGDGWGMTTAPQAKVFAGKRDEVVL